MKNIRVCTFETLLTLKYDPIVSDSKGDFSCIAVKAEFSVSAQKSAIIIPPVAVKNVRAIQSNVTKQKNVAQRISLLSSSHRKSILIPTRV